MGKIIEIYKKERINTRSRMLVAQSLIPEMIGIVEELDYRLYTHDSYFIGEHGFTIILTANGNNVKYFEQSIVSVLRQTYKHIELILIDHGCEPDLRALLRQYFEREDKIKLIVFEKNLYDPNDTRFINNGFSHVLNAALYCSEGEYVYFLSYDDFLSANYAECLSELFQQNDNCLVSSPAVVSVNAASQINESKTDQLQRLNVRPTYINGITLALSIIEDKQLFAAPGGLCAYRTSVVLSNGGLDTMNDLSQIFKYSVLGDVGTSLRATLYWRHHTEQTNRKNTKLGALYYAVHLDWYRHIQEFYAINEISIDYQNKFNSYMVKRIHDTALSSIQDSILAGGKAIANVYFNILKELPKIYHLYFLFFLIISLPRKIFNLLPNSLKIFVKYVKKLIS